MSDNTEFPHVYDERTSSLNNNKSILDNQIHTYSYCGEKIEEREWAFMSATHLLNTIVSGSAITPCPKCKAKIVQILNN